MGALSFRLPSGLSAAVTRDLERSCVAGGYDSMPAVCKASVANGCLVITREAEESAALVAPFEVAGAGRFLGSSATLVQRADPYGFVTELARGKINQLRCQAHDWSFSGMEMSDDLNDHIHAASHRFSKAVALPIGAAGDAEAANVLSDGYAAAHLLVRNYMDQLLQLRNARQGPLESTLGVRINGSIPANATADVAASFNHIGLPMCWRQVEPTESNYQWDATDAALAWAESRKMSVSAGPLIDLSASGLPDWLWLWQGDLQSLASFMCDYVETAVGRYRNRVRRWVLSAGANMVGMLKLGEEDLLWLTARLAEAAWQVDPDLELVISVCQPWGEYMARKEYTYSPFIFADTLIRAGLKLSALELEWVMGVSPRGSYCRDALEASRQLDLYALLGVPLQLALAYPCAEGADKFADAALSVGAGGWRSGFSPDTQADWAATFAKLAISKPFVRGATWAHLTDGEEHTLPHCGLLDATGNARPALAQLKKIKSDHLK
jgi:Glycosyl hydrolase family 10